MFHLYFKNLDINSPYESFYDNFYAFGVDVEKTRRFIYSFSTQPYTTPHDQVASITINATTEIFKSVAINTVDK